MPQRVPEAPDFIELAHSLRGPLNNFMLWAAVLRHQLRNAPPTVQRALDGLDQAVQAQVRIIELLERPYGPETSGPETGSERPRPRQS